MASRIIYLPFDHLHRGYGALKNADPKTDVIAMVESARMTTGRAWHPMRLFFLISSARHFAESLRNEGFSRTDFATWAGVQKSFLMENFYRAQRVRLNILVEGGKPTGGAWNFDKENRLPPPKNYEWPKYLEHSRDAIDDEVAKELNYSPGTTWATTREGALAQLKNFITNHFATFGPYEDAMANDNWAVHHSLLSPYLNNGLLHAQEVVDAAVQAFDGGSIPIASCEGFVRQIIGWREYVNGMYWYLGEEYEKNNQLGAKRELLPLLRDPEKTSMNCVKSIVTDINERAWVHHIPRLMAKYSSMQRSG